MLKDDSLMDEFLILGSSFSQDSDDKEENFAGTQEWYEPW